LVEPSSKGKIPGKKKVGKEPEKTNLLGGGLKSGKEGGLRNKCRGFGVVTPNG